MNNVKHLDGYNRFDLTQLLPHGSGYIGIELGVAAGEYSSKMVASDKFSTFWGG